MCEEKEIEETGQQMETLETEVKRFVGAQPYWAKFLRKKIYQDNGFLIVILTLHILTYLNN